MRKSGTAFEEKPTDEYLNIKNSIKAANEQVRKYEAKGDKLEATGVKKKVNSGKVLRMTLTRLIRSYGNMRIRQKNWKNQVRRQKKYLQRNTKI